MHSKTKLVTNAYEANPEDSKLELILKHLKKLVSFDTQNPPRAIEIDNPIFKYFEANLPGFSHQYFDAGNGSISLLSTKGKPKILFNFHIDTVPATSHWTQDPLTLTVSEEKASGLGSCDIKGAAACMLAAVSESTNNVALLFSSDEEHGNSDAIKYFLAQIKNDTSDIPCFSHVVVAEPTQSKAILAHRGIQTASATFLGKSGHASSHSAISDNAIHSAANWISAATDWIKNSTFEFDTLKGLPFNVGKITGGIKANMIADYCELTFGFRALPGQFSIQILEKLGAICVTPYAFEIKPVFYGPSLPAATQDWEFKLNQSKNLADKLKLEVGEAVDFWTEASLFSEAGFPAIVYGPGNIKQAHTANEWVELSQLEKVQQSYEMILKGESDNE